MNPQLGRLPTDFKCCRCQAPMLKGMSMLGHSRPVIRKGMIVVCSNCTTINVLGDSNLHPMSKQEFEGLTPQSQMAVKRTVFELRKRIESGGEWNPHEN